jgi:hypothetical protein
MAAISGCFSRRGAAALEGRCGPFERGAWSDPAAACGEAVGRLIEERPISRLRKGCGPRASRPPRLFRRVCVRVPPPRGGLHPISWTGDRCGLHRRVAASFALIGTGRCGARELGLSSLADGLGEFTSSPSEGEWRPTGRGRLDDQMDRVSARLQDHRLSASPWTSVDASPLGDVVCFDVSAMVKGPPAESAGPVPSSKTLKPHAGCFGAARGSA